MAISNATRFRFKGDESPFLDLYLSPRTAGWSEIGSFERIQKKSLLIATGAAVAGGLLYYFCRRPLGRLCASLMRTVQLKKRFEPTIYGIAHSGSNPELEFLVSLIESAHRRGARSMGLEMSPSRLREEWRTDFSPLADRAQQLGMKVVCLATDEVYDEGVILSSLKGVIDNEGRFAVKELANYRSGLKSRLEWFTSTDRRTYMSPELRRQQVHLQFELDRIKAMERVLQEIRSDLDRYADRWREWVARADRMMAAIIEKERPDLVFVGYGHLRTFPTHAGYKTVAVWKELMTVSEIDPAMRALANAKGQDFTDVVYQHLHVLAEEHFGRSVEGRDLGQILERAFVREPQLGPLTLRAYCGTDPRCWDFLIPGDDIAFLKLGTDEAQRRIMAALFAA